MPAASRNTRWKASRSSTGTPPRSTTLASLAGMYRASAELREALRQHPFLAAVTAAAVLAGIVVRFKGLATWPLAVDEYYLARSVENVLRTGAPIYDCGGLYPRGLLIQYLSAFLQHTGLG